MSDRHSFGIDQYEKSYISFLSVLADTKIEFIGLSRYRPIRKKAYRSPNVYNYLKGIEIATFSTFFTHHAAHIYHHHDALASPHLRL